MDRKGRGKSTLRKMRSVEVEVLNLLGSKEGAVKGNGSYRWGCGSSIICVCVWVEGWCRVIGLTVFSRKYLIYTFWK